MTKNMYVQSIKISRESNIPSTLFSVILKGIVKKDILVFMKAEEIVSNLVYDSSLKIIIADEQTKKLLFDQLSKSRKNDFTILEKEKYIVTEKN